MQYHMTCTIRTLLHWNCCSCACEYALRWYLSCHKFTYYGTELNAELHMTIGSLPVIT